MYGGYRQRSCQTDQRHRAIGEKYVSAGRKRMAEGKFEDVAYFVPFYLKDFVAKCQRNCCKMNNMNIEGLDYNTKREKLVLPEYGREIQNMVDYAVALPDKAERQKCGNHHRNHGKNVSAKP